MNEQELSKLLHEAADEVSVSATPSRRVLRRARLRMATTGVVALSLVGLLAGGSFALATRQVAAPQPNLKPASPVVTAPQEYDLPFIEEDEVILAEVEEVDSLWAFIAQARDDELCLSSNTLTREEAGGSGVDPSGFGAMSGIGDCEPLGVPNSRAIGFYMWDSGKNKRLEVLGAVSTEVARLELQGSTASDDVVTVIKAPSELGADRNFFYLWLPPHEVGTLVAYDEAGDRLLQEHLCLKAYEPYGSACTVGERRSVSGSGRAELGPDILGMACDEISRGRIGQLFAESTPEQAIQRWIDDLDLDLKPSEFEIERAGSDTAVMKLRTPEGASAVSATLSKKGDHQWSIVELFYCGGILDPPTEPPHLPKDLRQPPPAPPGSAPPSPSP